MAYRLGNVLFVLFVLIGLAWIAIGEAAAGPFNTINGTVFVGGALLSALIGWSIRYVLCGK